MMVEKSVPSGYVKIAIEMAIYSGVSQLENGGSFHRFLALFTRGYCISPDIWDNLE